ncbi:MAG: GntR family transcriptional regulator [Nocardioidaceae bacterium]
MSRQKIPSVRDVVLEQIEAMSPGEPLASERSLAADLHVSRMTLRRAVDDLVLAGMLVRRHGQGTFVAPPKMDQPLAITSFTEDMRSRGMQAGSRTLSSQIGPAGARLGHRLRISPDDEVITVTRLRLADNIPMAIEELSTATALVPGLTGADLEGSSFYHVLQVRYGVVIAEGRQSIEPTVTDADESRSLGVPLHSPAFLFQRTSATADGRAVEFVRSVYRGDRYQIVTDLAGQPSGGQG